MDNAANSGRRTTDPIPRLTPFYLANAFCPCKSSTLDTLRFMLSTTTNAVRLHVRPGRLSVRIVRSQRGIMVGGGEKGEGITRMWCKHDLNRSGNTHRNMSRCSKKLIKFKTYVFLSFNRKPRSRFGHFEVNHYDEERKIFHATATYHRKRYSKNGSKFGEIKQQKCRIATSADCLERRFADKPGISGPATTVNRQKWKIS